MLLMTSNIDRTDEAAISNWPFTYDSTLDTGDGILPISSFLAISVNVDETTQLPCRFKGVTSDGKLVVCDATGAEVCAGQMYAETHVNDDTHLPDEWVSFLLYNKYNVLCGFVTCKSDTVARLYALSKYTNGMHYFNADAFIFLPQCHSQTVHGHCRSIGINGDYQVRDVTIRCTTDGGTGHNIIPEGYPSGSLVDSVSYGVFNIAVPEKNKWCRISVNGKIYNVEGKNLIIKAATASNLRVVHSDAAIILRGVEDA